MTLLRRRPGAPWEFSSSSRDLKADLSVHPTSHTDQCSPSRGQDADDDPRGLCGKRRGQTAASPPGAGEKDWGSKLGIPQPEAGRAARGWFLGSVGRLRLLLPAPPPSPSSAARGPHVSFRAVSMTVITGVTRKCTLCHANNF